MDVKLNVCLLLLLVGALCVQGLRLRQESKNEPSFIKTVFCDEVGGQCVPEEILCYDISDYPIECPEYYCPGDTRCCCPE